MEDTQEQLVEEQTEGIASQETETQEPDHEAANKAFFARMKKAEDKVRSLEEQLKAVTPKHPVEGGFSTEELLEARLEVPNREAMDYLKRFAKGSGLSLGDALKDPFVQAGIKAISEKQKSEEATPAPSTKVASMSSKSNKPWSSLTEEERRANFAAHAQKFAKRGARSSE